MLIPAFFNSENRKGQNQPGKMRVVGNRMNRNMWQIASELQDINSSLEHATPVLRDYQTDLEAIKEELDRIERIFDRVRDTPTRKSQQSFVLR